MKQGYMRNNIRLCLLGILMIVSMVLTACERGGTVPDTAATEQETENTEPEIVTTLAVIKNIDLENQEIQFVGVNQETEYTLFYHGGVDLTDKYGNIIAISQVNTGEIMDITYYADSMKLISMQINMDAVRYEAADGVLVDEIQKKLTVMGQSYSYGNQIVVSSDGEEMDLAEVCKEDQVRVCIYQGKVCSVLVTLGHGYVKLEDYETYIDGMIEIGYDVIVPVTEDMLLTVREGEYRLKITKGEHSGYKNIVVEKNQQVTVSLSELQIQPDKVGEVCLSVTPKDAKVYVDGTVVNLDEPLSLTYGKHYVKITADGYEAYTGYFTVEEAYKIHKFALAETESDTEESTEDTTGSSDTTVSTGNTITVQGPIGATLYVDSEYVGEIPVTFEKTVGSHVLTLSQTGCTIKSYTITAADDGKNDTYTFDELPSVLDLLE